MSNVKKCIQFNTQQTMISNLYVNIIDNKVFLCALGLLTFWIIESKAKERTITMKLCDCVR